MLTRKNLDELSPASRDFYERAYMKLSLSLIFASLGMMFLGLCAGAGGISQSNQYTIDSINHDDGALQDLVSGYGFASFAFIVASILAFAAAIYFSPFVASKNEGNILRTPQDIEQYDGNANNGGVRPYDGRTAVAQPVHSNSSTYQNPMNQQRPESSSYPEKDMSKI